MLLGVIVSELGCSHGAYMSCCTVILVPNNLNKENFEVKKFCKGLVLKVLKWMPGICYNVQIMELIHALFP